MSTNNKWQGYDRSDSLTAGQSVGGLQFAGQKSADHPILRLAISGRPRPEPKTDERRASELEAHGGQTSKQEINDRPLPDPGNAPFIPSYRVFCGRLRIRQSRAAKVAIPIRLLKYLIQQALLQLPFDERAYCARHKDVAAAIESGAVSSGREHFIQTGYFEGRTIPGLEVDEDFYRQEYPDVDKGISDGRVSDAAAHYSGNGELELRIPNPEVRAAINVWSELFDDRPQ